MDQYIDSQDFEKKKKIPDEYKPNDTFAISAAKISGSNEGNRAATRSNGKTRKKADCKTDREQICKNKHSSIYETTWIYMESENRILNEEHRRHSNKRRNSQRVERDRTVSIPEHRQGRRHQCWENGKSLL